MFMYISLAMKFIHIYTKRCLVVAAEGKQFISLFFLHNKRIFLICFQFFRFCEYFLILYTIRVVKSSSNSLCEWSDIILWSEIPFLERGCEKASWKFIRFVCYIGMEEIFTWCLLLIFIQFYLEKTLQFEINNIFNKLIWLLLGELLFS